MELSRAEIERVFISELADDLIISTDRQFPLLHDWARTRADVVRTLAEKLGLDPSDLRFKAITEVQRRQRERGEMIAPSPDDVL